MKIRILSPKKRVYLVSRVAMLNTFVLRPKIWEQHGRKIWMSTVELFLSLTGRWSVWPMPSTNGWICSPPKKTTMTMMTQIATMHQTQSYRMPKSTHNIFWSQWTNFKNWLWGKVWPANYVPKTIKQVFKKKRFYKAFWKKSNNLKILYNRWETKAIKWLI